MSVTRVELRRNVLAQQSSGTNAAISYSTSYEGRVHRRLSPSGGGRPFGVVVHVPAVRTPELFVANINAVLKESGVPDDHLIELPDFPVIGHPGPPLRFGDRWNASTIEHWYSIVLHGFGNAPIPVGDGFTIHLRENQNGHPVQTITREAPFGTLEALRQALTDHGVVNPGSAHLP